MERVRMGPIGQRPCGELERDEMGHNVISHINVSFDKMGVTSIQFGYVENGALIVSTAVCSRRILRLNHELEFVTGISGLFVTGVRGQRFPGYISSLTFYTNQRAIEAVHLTSPSRKVGHEKMEFHSGILEGREFEGFFGSCGYCHLTSIGFEVRLVLPDVKTSKKEKV